MKRLLTDKSIDLIVQLRELLPDTPDCEIIELALIEMARYYNENCNQLRDAITPILAVDKKTSTLLGDLARQTFRTRSGMIALLVEREYQRQVEEMRKATPTAAEVVENKETE